jgi:hypothetical protein
MMTGCPFDKELLERLACQDVSETERKQLIEHLESGCPECEGFFSDLEGEYYEILIGLYLGGSAGVKEESGLSRRARKSILSAVQDELSGNPEAAYSNSSWVWKKQNVLALAAGLILILGILFFAADQFLFSSNPSTTSTKGDAVINEANIFLQFLVLRDDQEGDEIIQAMRGVNQGVYQTSDKILFRYEIDRAAWVYIVRLDKEGGGEVLYPAGGDRSERRQAGTHDANDADQIMVYPLKDVRGVQTFCAVASVSEMADMEGILSGVRTMLEQNIENNNSFRLRKGGLDCFQIKVEESW